MADFALEFHTFGALNQAMLLSARHITKGVFG